MRKEEITQKKIIETVKVVKKRIIPFSIILNIRHTATLTTTGGMDLNITDLTKSFALNHSSCRYK